MTILARYGDIIQFGACAFANLRANGAPHLSGIIRYRPPSGRSSGVEHNLAKVGVEGSNPFARSRFTNHRKFVAKPDGLASHIGCSIANVMASAEGRR